MTLIALQSVHKRYIERQVLQGISMMIEEGERIGLVGPNGSGKSTILRILAGVETPDEGERVVRRELHLGHLAQEPALDPDATVEHAVREGLAGRAELVAELDHIHAELSSPHLREERLTALLARQTALEDGLHVLGGHDIDHAVAAMIARLGLLDPRALCGNLSGGEKRRVALARLLLSEPELLLLDEPTNHLDALVTDWLEDFLLESKIPLVLVTHDRYFLDRVVHRILEVDRGQLHNYDGGYGDFVVARAERLASEGRAEQGRLNVLRRETEWMRRGPPARTTKAKARIGRYRALVASAPTEVGPDLQFAIPPGPRLGDRVITLAKVSKALGGRTLIDGLEMDIGPRTRLGIVGRNGAGKTTFLKLCMGLLQPDAGSVGIGPTVKFAAIDQTRSELDPDRTVVEEVAGFYEHVRTGDRSVRVETFLEQFLFPGAMKHASVGKLSGGERNRVLLAKLLLAGGNVLVLDEPTNDLDLMTLRVLEEALMAFPGAVLVVSHDRYFLDRVANRILHLDGDGRARVHEGDLSALLAKMASERGGPASKTKVATAAASASKPRRASSKDKRELAELPDRIGGAEKELAALDTELADPALYRGQSSRLPELKRRREELQARIANLYRRWEELENER